MSPAYSKMAVSADEMTEDQKQFFQAWNPALMRNPFLRRYPLPTTHRGNNLNSISNPSAARAIADRWLLAYNRGTKQGFTQLMAPNGAVVDAQYTSAPELLEYNDATRFPNNVVKGFANVSYYFDLLSCFSRKDRDETDFTDGGYGSDFNICTMDCYGGGRRRLLGSTVHMIDVAAEKGCLYGKEGDADCDFQCGNFFGVSVWDDGAPLKGTFVETSFTAYNSGFWQELQYKPSEDYDENSNDGIYSEGATFMVNVQVDRYGRALKYTSYNHWNPTNDAGVTRYGWTYVYENNFDD